MEFKLWGDSVIIDAMMEPGDSSSQQWLVAKESTPLMKFEVFSTHLSRRPGHIDEWLQEGQWIVAEKDRAIFVVPKSRIMWRNLRVCPRVRLGASTRYPVLAGRWMQKRDTRCWYFWLKVDSRGGIVKSGWRDDDVPPVF